MTTATPTVTPVSCDVDFLALHAAAPDRYPFLLESSASAPSLGRYDILFAFPGETLQLDADFSLAGAAAGGNTDFLVALDRWWADHDAPAPQIDLPFAGGWFVFLGYELAQEVEPRLTLPTEPGMPVAFATRVPAALIRDRVDNSVWCVAEAGHADKMAAVIEDVGSAPAYLPAVGDLVDGDVLEEEATKFLTAVEMAQAHIAAGDIFQANLSRVWQAQLRSAATPAELYARLRRTNPAPFSGLMVHQDMAVVSSSPERLLRRTDRRIETRPIAGTRPRYEQLDLRSELISHPKERAEHLMLIDLERNDLGRICRAGSISVDEFMIVESYSHVHHIVSNVAGEPRPGLAPGEMLRAIFPGGSITGCPKVRCMEIIQQLEARPRGPYTGAMGYINLDGSCDFNILIRTFVMNQRRLSLAAGSGIVADSDPQAELDETRAKARGVLLALAA